MATCSDFLNLEKRILFFQELGDTGGIYLIQYKYDLNIYYIGRTIKFKNRFRSHIKQHKSTDRFHRFATIVG
jgi:predicted GIY-YIG superfamily endonuclease